MTRFPSRWVPPMLLVAACGIPTELPLIDSVWLVPLRADSVAIAELLPDGVTVEGVHFALEFSVTETERTLGGLCPSCPNAIAPKPPFEGSLVAGTTLPADVVRATLADGGELALTLRHELSFDPLRPSATNRGWITVTLSSGTAVIATSVLDGNDTALPPQVIYHHTIPIPGGVVIENDVEIEVTVASPAGDPAQLDQSQRVFASVAPRGIRATSAVVRVEGRAVSPTTTEVNTGDLSEEIRSRVLRATLELVLSNPLPVQGAFTLRFLSGGAPVITDRPVTLAGGNETIEVPLDEEETAALLETDRVVVEFAGTVSGPVPTREVTVTPTQVIRIAPRLLLDARIGG